MSRRVSTGVYVSAYIYLDLVGMDGIVLEPGREREREKERVETPGATATFIRATELTNT